MDQRAHRRRTFHRVRQPNVQRKLPRFANRAAENQQRDRGRARAERDQPADFERAVAAIIKKQRAAVLP